MRPASSFASIADARARSVALFQEAGKVLQHPRCVNCHPARRRPTQTDRMRPHEPLVVRGADGHGAPAHGAATTCHGDANYDPARVPGDPQWHLAPASMAWEGMSLGEICEQIKDPERNGNRTIAGIVEHVTTDSLVKWGWNPGAGRTPAPGTNEEFGDADARLGRRRRALSGGLARTSQFCIRAAALRWCPSAASSCRG